MVRPATLSPAFRHVDANTGGRMTKRLAVFAVFGMLCISPGIATVSAAQAASGGSATRTFSDYLDVGGTGQAECHKPVQARVGAWFCAVSVKRTSGHGVLAASSNYCAGPACWSQIDEGHATAELDGNYGYGSTTLGGTTVYQKVVASGTYIKTYPEYFTSTRGTRSVYLSTEDLYLSSACTAGCAQSPRKYAQVGPYTGTADVSVQWPSASAAQWSNGVAWVTVTAEAAWSDPSSAYPGQWDAWIKSIKLQRQSSGAYYVQSAQTLPASPIGGNWFIG